MENRLNRSFSRRIGKSLSNLQQNLLSTKLLDHIIDSSQPLKFAKEHEKIYLEIGIGMGEHFIEQASLKPNATFIGFEPYQNGVANALKLAEQKNISNIKLWPDDADLVLNNIPQNSLDGIYILFPDPWPKLKQKKRRFVNEARLSHLYSLLKTKAFLVFASDIDNYTTQVIEFAAKVGLKNNSAINNNPHEGYIITKFHQKAIAAGRIPQFLQFSKE